MRWGDVLPGVEDPGPTGRREDDLQVGWPRLTGQRPGGPARYPERLSRAGLQVSIPITAYAKQIPVIPVVSRIAATM